MLTFLKAALLDVATSLGLRHEPPSVTLFVMDGPNAGTVQKLAPAAYRVGSGLEADIVLADDALAPVHALIDFADGRVRIEPLAGSVTIPARPSAIEPGGAITLPLPVEMSLGASRIVLRVPVEEAVRKTRLRRTAAAAGLATILGGLSGIAMSSGGGQLAALPGPGVAAMQQATQMMTPAPVAPRQETPQQALQVRISGAGLAGVTLTTKDSHIVASGRLSAAEMVQWREIQAWFDRTFASSVVLSSEVTTGRSSSAPELVIQAVWTGENPYVVTHTGSKYFQGADLGGGWAVESIRPDAVTLRSRSGEVFVMGLTDPGKP